MSGSKKNGGGRGRPQARPEDAALVAHEEEGVVSKRWQGLGYAGVRREVEQGTVRADYPRQVEQLAYDRVSVEEGDSGEVERLSDGSISIPLFEEELVVTKRTVLRERILIRKETITEIQRVEEELRREYVTFDTSEVTEDSIQMDDDLREDR